MSFSTSSPVSHPVPSEILSYSFKESEGKKNIKRKVEVDRVREYMGIRDKPVIVIKRTKIFDFNNGGIL